MPTVMVPLIASAISSMLPLPSLPPL